MNPQSLQSPIVQSSPVQSSIARKISRVALPTLAALLAGVGAANAQIFTNPGFESGFTGWTTSQGNGAATFSTTTTSPYVGSNSAQIVVTTPGTTFPSLTQTFTASASQTYMLRYYAKATTNRPTMNIHVSSASGPVYSAAKINPSSNGWEEYHWPFKASGATTVTFTFETATTYGLDQVQVYDTNSPADQNGNIMDPERCYLWHWGQTAGATGGLMNTDNSISVPLPDGRVAWLFNDSYTGTINPYNNSGGTAGFVRNMLFTQNGGSLTPWAPGKTSFTPAVSGDWTWPTDAFVEGSKLKIILPDISSTQTNGVNIATFSLPAMTQDSYPATYLPWAISHVLDGGDGYFYLYNGSKVGRVPVGSFDTTAAWRYWDGSTWNTSSSAAVAMTNYSSAISFERLGPNNFVETYAGFVGGTIRARFAPAPQGPWTSADITLGTPTWEADTSYYYMPYLHRETAQNGVYSLSYSDIGSDGADGAGFVSNRPGKDQCYYNIEFFRTPNLLTASPYTSNVGSDNFSTGDATGWQTYSGTWTASGGSYSVTGGSGAKAIFKGIVTDDINCAANVSVNGGDAGILFRASKYAIGTDSYSGYYAGIQTGVGVILGKANGSWTQLASAAMTINANTVYPVRVTARGSAIKVYVSDMTTPKISITDTTYASGGVGLRTHSTSAVFDNFDVNGVQEETELLAATATAGVTHRVFAWDQFSGGAGTILDATATGQQVTYTVPAIAAGTYDVRVAVKETSTRGTWQLAAASAVTGSFSNIGAVQDEYSSTDQVAEYDLGNWSPGSTSDKLFRFTVVGKNASSTGYSISFDYIKLIPQ